MSVKYQKNNPTYDEELYLYTEYDVNCPKCKELVFSKRDDGSQVVPEFKCPNCDSGVVLIDVRWQNKAGFPGGQISRKYLTCTNECGWNCNLASAFSKVEISHITHEKCGAQISGEKFVVGIGQADKGSCFIATACYESYDHPNVVVLRKFRDSVLSKNIAGKEFIKLYYKHGFKLAEFLDSNILTKKTIKPVIRKILGIFVSVIKQVL